MENTYEVELESLVVARAGCVGGEDVEGVTCRMNISGEKRERQTGEGEGGER